MARLVGILHALCSANNMQRVSAERELETLKYDGSDLLSELLQLSRLETVEISLRKLALILVRRIICSQDGYGNLDELKRINFRANLLLGLGSNTSERYLQAKLCDIIGHLIGYELDVNSWPEVMHFISSSMQSQDPFLLESTFSLLGSLCVRDIDIVVQHIDPIAQALHFYLIHPTRNPGLQLASLRAFSSILASLSQESPFRCLHQLMSSVFVVLNDMLTDCANTDSSKEDVICAFIENLIDIAEESVRFLTEDMSSYLPMILSHIENPQQPSFVRNMLLEFVVVLATNAPKYVRKLKSYEGERGFVFKRLMAVCEALMSTIPEDPRWHLSTNDEDDLDEEFQSYDIGETSLDRLFKALGLKACFPLLISRIGHLLNQQHSWVMLHNGLRALGNSLELTAQLGKRDLASHHADVCNTIAFYSRHEHPRVRAAAFYAVGQLYLMHGRKLPVERVNALILLLLDCAGSPSNAYPRLKLYVSVVA